MLYRIESIRLKWPCTENILPEADFVLVNKQNIKLNVYGWLPIHHGHCWYDLNIKHGKITHIINMKMGPKPKTSGKIIQKAARSLPKRNKKNIQELRQTYIQMAKKALIDMSLWVISPLYSHYTIRFMDRRHIFSLITVDVENICRRGSPAAISKLLYNKTEAKNAIIKALYLMGELPYNDWEGFEARMDWQIHTSRGTASVTELSSKHIPNVQKYKGKWTTTQEINIARKIGKFILGVRPQIVIGSPCPSFIRERVCVQSLEDAYMIKCFVLCDICILPSARVDSFNLKKLGLLGVTELQPNQQVHVVYAHRWSVEHWLELVDKNANVMSINGRLDQWSTARGQIFRDLCESNKIQNIQYSHHRATENIITMQKIENVQKFADEIRKKWKVVQFFHSGYKQNRVFDHIDYGRRQLTHPFRKRTQSEHETNKLVEEHNISHVHTNIGTVPVRTYNGLHVHASVFFCDENTTSFDIHVARTWATDALYIVEQWAKAPCMFATQRRPARKITVNPFT